MHESAGWALVGFLWLGSVVAETAQQPRSEPSLPSETPARFEAVTDSFDYVRRDAMIPMRDGVKLHTVILVPKGASRAPILLTRTPYNATALTSHTQAPTLAWFPSRGCAVPVLYVDPGSWMCDDSKSGDRESKVRSHIVARKADHDFRGTTAGTKAVSAASSPST